MSILFPRKVVVKAFNASGPVLNDAANLSCTLEKDGNGSPVALTNNTATELTNGKYEFTLSDDERRTVESLHFSPSSSTAGVDVVVSTDLIFVGQTSNDVYLEYLFHASTSTGAMIDETYLQFNNSNPINATQLALTRADLNGSFTRQWFGGLGNENWIHVSKAGASACTMKVTSVVSSGNKAIFTGVVTGFIPDAFAQDDILQVRIEPFTRGSLLRGVSNETLQQWVKDDTGETSAADQSVAKLSQGAGSGGGCDGPGGTQITLTVFDNQIPPQPLNNVDCWLTTDQAGTNTYAGTKSTDGNGQVWFMCDPGSYWWHKQKGGYNFESEVVTVTAE